MLLGCLTASTVWRPPRLPEGAKPTARAVPGPGYQPSRAHKPASAFSAKPKWRSCCAGGRATSQAGRTNPLPRFQQNRSGARAVPGAGPLAKPGARTRFRVFSKTEVALVLCRGRATGQAGHTNPLPRFQQNRSGARAVPGGPGHQPSRAHEPASAFSAKPKWRSCCAGAGPPAKPGAQTRFRVFSKTEVALVLSLMAPMEVIIPFRRDDVCRRPRRELRSLLVVLWRHLQLEM